MRHTQGTGHSEEDTRIVGPASTAFPVNVKWKLGEEHLRPDAMSTKTITHALQNARAVPPHANVKWKEKFCDNDLPVYLTWKIKIMYASARDQFAWYKLRHRNLYVANRDTRIPDPTCLCCRLRPESMLHLAECTEIKDSFWEEIYGLMAKLGLKYERTSVFRVLGIMSGNETVDKEGAGLLALAWRCMYAEIVRARVEDTEPLLEKALKRTVSMMIGRVKAYGEKWRRWHLRNRNTTRNNIIPLRHRNYKMIEVEQDGTYYVAEELTAFLEELEQT